MSGLVATGNSVLWALGLEDRFGVPGAGALVAYDPVLPVDGSVVSSESPPIQVNRYGFVRAGVPGPKGGSLTWGHPLSPGHMLEYLHHLLGQVTKDEPDTGIFRYVFSPAGPADHVNNSIWGLLAKEPVERQYFYGGRFGSMEITIGDNVAIPIKFTGMLSHGTRIGAAEPDPANLGTYTLGPWLRGPLRDPTAGDVWINISRDVAGGGLQYQVAQSVGDPALWGTAVDVSYDADGNPIWQNLQNANGIDLGIWDEKNKDPLELIIPGTVAEHGDLAIGDQFRFPVEWPSPALSTIPTTQEFTSAFWQLRVRAIGASQYLSQHVNSGSFKLDYPIVADRGNDTRYPYDLIRPGQLTPTLQLKRSYVSRWYIDLAERHGRIDVECAFAGEQRGSGQYRQSLVIRMPSCGIAKAESPVSGPDRIEETVDLNGETDDDGNPPIEVTVITVRDWAPPA